MSDKYDDYDWSELDDEAKKYAKVLGYDKKKWDKDSDLPLDEYDWDELTKEQQTAAKFFGYTKKSWNEDD